MGQPAVLHLLLTVLLVIAAAPLGAAELQKNVELRGVVRDSMGLPMEGVEVLLSGPTSESATTAMDGSYRFQVADDGTYRLSASRNGFREWSRDVTLTAASASQI